MSNVGSVRGVSALSERQVRCLELRAQRFTLKEIGQKLGVSQHTVDGHLEAAQRTLGAASRREAVEIYVHQRTGEQSTGDIFGVAEARVTESDVDSPETSIGMLSDLQIVQPLDAGSSAAARRGKDETEFGSAKHIVRFAIALLIIIVLALVIFETLDRLIPRLL